MNLRSTLYAGTVTHRRVRPRPHRLRYRVFWMLLDLDEITRRVAFALERQLLHVESYGGMPVTVYQPHPTRPRHGNFFDESYAAMLAIPEWRKRMEKVHTSARSALPKSGCGRCPR